MHPSLGHALFHICATLTKLHTSADLQARNAKGALRGERPAATGEEYTNSTEPTQQTAHPEGTTGANDSTTSTHDVSTIKQGFKTGPHALTTPSDSGPGTSGVSTGAPGSSSSHKGSSEVIRPPGEGARIIESKPGDSSFAGVGGASDGYKHTASGTELRMAEGGLGSAEAVAPIRNEPRPGVETYGSSNPAAPAPKSIQEGFNTHTPMVQTTGDEGKKYHTGTGVDGDAERMQQGMQNVSLSGKSGKSGSVGGVGDTQGMPKDEAALMGMDAQGTGLQQSSEQRGVLEADSKRM